MAKLNVKNGFEYTHERHFFGSWVYYWYVRPQNSAHWMPFSILSGSAKKVDVEDFLENNQQASRSYSEWLARAGNIDLAQKNLEAAESRLARISEPDWGGRGNNPNKDVRIIKDAHAAVDSARNALSLAQKINS